MTEIVAPNAEEYLGPERRAKYLDLLSQGVALSIAAREVGCTGTQIRRLRKRDAGFGQEVAEAIDEGRQHYADRLSSQARLRALDMSRPSDRILEVELATHVPGYEHLRRDRMRVEARVEHGIIALPPGALDALPKDKLEALVQILHELGSGIVDGEATEIDDDDPPGLPVAT